MERIEFEDALVVEPAKVSILDELPVGAEIDYNGDIVPEGWEEEIIDYTSKCKFKNCTFGGGAIYKIGKIVFIQILVTATIDHEWGDLIEIPDELYPIGITAENGTYISGTNNFWVYGKGTCAIRGTIAKDKNYNIVGSYLANN